MVTVSCLDGHFQSKRGQVARAVSYIERIKVLDKILETGQFTGPDGQLLSVRAHISEAQGERIDFAFIDGAHTFDHVLVDFFYIDRMLNVGGIVAFDDVGFP